MKKSLFAIAASAFVLAALPMPVAAQDKKSDDGKITDVHPEGRSVTYGGKKLAVSGSRTKITIGGKEAARDQLKSGMSCKVDAKDDAATRIDCK